MLDFLQAASDGVLFGATYALIGIGFTLVFGVMHKINMAYAAASVGGAYAGLLVLTVMANAPPALVFFGAFVAGGLLGWIVYVTCFHFIPLSSPLATLMSTVGMLLLIDEVIVHVTAGMPQAYPAMFGDVMLFMGEFSMRGDLLLVAGVSVLAMIALLALLYRSSLGLATRAVAQQPVAAQLCGIRPVRVNALTFVVTGLLGGLAGALIGASVGTLSPLLTTPLTVKGLIVTVIGGLGSIPGAIVAGLLVGGFENVLQLYRGVTERDLYVMLLLFAFLTFRPGGLFAPKGGRD
ncbi:MAG: branched-chain amino acid ABC transporter permease [Betaproteobacteria bacterium]|nr:branched-chain amino acid ABC transporter permease [Betaproteobacteria bacterium]MDH5537458.1 branched-chain amino acid ABC transporter permease [Betaproteobacteria bacterium]